jgi:hypothetical protein
MISLLLSCASVEPKDYTNIPVGFCRYFAYVVQKYLSQYESMEQNPVWEGNSHSASHDIPQPFMEPQGSLCAI